MKNTLRSLAALVAVSASVAFAAVALLAVPFTVTSTTWTAPSGFSLDVPKVSAAYYGGLSSMTACSAAVTVKSAALADLNVRATFNGTAGAQYGSTATNADGSKTFTFVIVNPPNESGVSSSKCRARPQLRKTAAGNPDVTLDPAAGDVLKIEG